MAQSIPATPQSSSLGGRKVLVAALILGAITAGLIVAFLARANSGSETFAPVGDVEVVVAKADIVAGTTITKEMVEVKKVPSTALVTGALSEVSSVVDETARYPMVKGEQFTAMRLVEPPLQKSLSFAIPEGLRGYTVPVEQRASASALLVPGDFVDVIVRTEIVHVLPAGQDPNATLTVDGDEKPKAASTLIQNVQVLSVERNFVDAGVPYDQSTRGEPSEDGVDYVTLAVTPEQAQLLWLAGTEGNLTLVLRAFGDDKVTDLTSVVEPIRLP